MNLFDLIFLACAAAALLTLAMAAVRGVRLLRRLAVAMVVYFAIVVAVSLIAPRREYKIGEEQCFDDWCIAVTKAERNGGAIEVTAKVSSRARRVAQREKNLRLFVTDDRDRRFEALAEGASGEFDALLQPGESAEIRRRFAVSADAQGVGVVITHEGGFPIGWLIIGYDTWFRKPPVIPIGGSPSVIR